MIPVVEFQPKSSLLLIDFRRLFTELLSLAQESFT